MNTASQNYPGAAPSITPQDPGAAAGTASPADAYLSASAQALTAVVAAEMSKDAPVTPRDIAAAELRAGVVFDAARVEAVRTAAYEQAKAEDRAELAQAAEDREERGWVHSRWQAVGRLCEDRHPDDWLKVGEVLAVLEGRAPEMLPLTVRWDGTVAAPAGDGPGESTLVAGITARGGRAVLDHDQRLRLGERLLNQVHAAETCRTPGCGMADLDASDPSLYGWILLDVAGTEGGPRWWCTPQCVHAAVVAAAAELVADQAAGLEGGRGNVGGGGAL
ncbi:hypothetical protein [Streptomyces chartreusis]|uniref:hypothetical protein n=1 Tax=Streptomyces chartreusis TaxID=1969 RepID=UPI0037F55C36